MTAASVRARVDGLGATGLSAVEDAFVNGLITENTIAAYTAYLAEQTGEGSASTSAAAAAGSATAAASSASAASASAAAASGSATTASGAASTATTQASAASASATAAAASATAAAASAAIAADLPPEEFSDTALTLAVGDAGRARESTSGSPISVTLPAEMPVGKAGVVCQAGTGQITFVAASGATIRQEQGLTKTYGRWSEVTWRVRKNAGGSAAEYVLQGSMI